MNKDILFEQKKMKGYSKIVIIATAATQLLFLYFFSVVGRFEPSDADNILKEYSAIVGLASATTICSLVIYGAVVINRFIVCDFIGDSRTRTYLYPEGRNKLYYRKITAFITTFMFMVLVGASIANIIFFSSESVVTILQSNENVSQDIATFIISSLVIALATTTMVIISSIIGIYFSSTVSTIIAGIIFVVFLGNFIAISFIKYQHLILLISILMILFTFLGVKMMGNRIKNDEILYK